jgi:hypothetical protein
MAGCQPAPQQSPADCPDGSEDGEALVRRHGGILLVAAGLVLVALTAQGFDWADHELENASLFDYDADEEYAPLRQVGLFKKQGRRRWGPPDFGPGKVPGPIIPEPMVFDLVRPLNARKGELEANVLAIFPMKRGPGGVSGLPDPIGAVPLPGKGQGIEWAPEIEWCPRDGVTWEVEFPFIDDRFEAFKIAHQRMIGTAFDDRFIHGWQAIGLNDFDSGTTTLALLWVAGWRFNETWSTLALIGGRQEIGPPGFRGTEYLQNVSLFADLTDDFLVGIETNYQQDTTGPAACLLMPQFQWQLTRCLPLQAGAGYRFATGGNLPEAAIRVIMAN